MIFKKKSIRDIIILYTISGHKHESSTTEIFFPLDILLKIDHTRTFSSI